MGKDLNSDAMEKVQGNTAVKPFMSKGTGTLKIKKEPKELRSKSLTVLVKPSVYEVIRKTAVVEEISINEVVNQIFDDFCSRRGQ